MRTFMALLLCFLFPSAQALTKVLDTVTAWMNPAIFVPATSNVLLLDAAAKAT